MAQRQEAPSNLACRNCGAVNPPKTYCCLKCFQVLRPKEKVPFWKIYVRPDASVLAVIIIVAGIGIYVAKRWMDNIEAQVTMNFSSTDYNVSVVADKKKKGGLLGRMGISNSSETPANSDATQAAPAPSNDTPPVNQ